MHEPAFRQLVVPALLCTGIATLLVWAGLTRSPGLQVPPSVAYLVAAILTTAALALLAKAARRPRVVDWLVVVVLAGFVIVGGWVALNATADVCRGGVGAFSFRVGALHCRTAFGLGALVNAGLTIYAVRVARRRQRPTA